VKSCDIPELLTITNDIHPDSLNALVASVLSHCNKTEDGKAPATKEGQIFILNFRISILSNFIVAIIVRDKREILLIELQLKRTRYLV
jgi:hypothetical protein